MLRSFAVASLIASASAADFTTCDTDKLGVKSVDISPAEPVAGQDCEVTTTGHSSVEVNGGEATLTAKAFGVTIINEKLDLCKDMGLTCPLAAGADFTTKTSFAVPSITPSGVETKVEMTVADANGGELTCLKLKVETGKSSSLRSNKSSSREEVEYLFEAWRRQFSMEFKSAEEHMKRFNVFASNHVRIQQHNNSGASYTMGHNQFSHLSAEEFADLNIRGFSPDANVEGTKHEFDLDVSKVPKSKDWTKEGAVTAVKDQGQCGSCWSFSTTGSLEGGYFLKTGELKTLSEQELVDCDHIDSGCNGGLMDYAFGYVEKNGLAAENAYSYTASDGQCRESKYPRVLPAGALKGYTDVPQGNEKALKAAVAHAPVSIAIEADQTAFQFYSGGVMTGRCGHNLDHGVLAVGYGTEDNTDYWKVKNSWGAGWGEDGYIRIERGTGKCGVADSASYPKF